MLSTFRHIPRVSRNFSSASTIKVDDPYTGEIYCEVDLLDETEVMSRAAIASEVQTAWAKTPLSERIAVCDRMIKAMHANADQISRDISCMMGKPEKNARGEIAGMEERARGMMELAESALADEVLPAKDNFVRRITKEPVGTVLVLAPWNYPLLTSVNTIVPAVLAGNSVLIKQSGRTPLCANHFADAFAAAGAPEGLVQVVNCSHEVSASLIESRKVNFVAFTGSVQGGQAVYETVGRSTFIDATLELGGKDPAFVAEDADISAAAEGLVDGAFFNAGQSCCGIERVYVHRSHYESFLEKAAKIISGYVLGDPRDPSTTMGPLATQQSADFLYEQVQDAVAKGARVITGGKPCNDAAGKGRFFAPTLLAECDHSMEIMTEESFGPVLGVCPVDSEEEAVRLMNDSQYGLTAVIFSNSVETADRLAPQLEAGTIFLNRCDYLDPLLPWGGVKDTGKGVSLSPHGFSGVTKLKGYHFKIKA
eukprot:g4452.t1